MGSLENKKTTISEVIFRYFRRKNCYFEQLGEFEKTAVIKYIKTQNIDCKVFKQRGFDVLSQTLFAFEYELMNDQYGFLVAKPIRRDFKTFKEYFDYLDGDIYDSSCYLGYEFNPNEINKYNINITKTKSVCFDSSETIDDVYTNLFYAYDFKKKESLVQIEKMQNWFNKHRVKKSSKEILEYFKEFKKRFPSLYSGKVYSSVMIRKYKEIAEDVAIYMAANLGYESSINPLYLLNEYGEEAARTAIENYSSYCTKETLKRRIKQMNRTLDKCVELDLKKRRICNYDLDTFAYRIIDEYYDGDEFVSKCEHYFIEFDELVDFLCGNLSGCDFSNAPVERSKILLYKTDNLTKLPPPNTFFENQIAKIYDDHKFVVAQRWLDEEGRTIFESIKKFDFICDFIFFLNGDLSNSDFLMCDGIEHLYCIKNLKLDRIKVRSKVAGIMKIGQKEFSNKIPEITYFDNVKRNELATINSFVQTREIDDGSGCIAYVTDIHLLHRIEANHCLSQEDANYTIRKIAKEFNNCKCKNIFIGGDISSDVDIYKCFIKELTKYNKKANFFITLGNHELWSFNNLPFERIVETYRDILGYKNTFLVHNNLFVINYDSVIEITCEELKSINTDALKEKTRTARMIVFGGMGFSGLNSEFNANSGIYRGVISREQEIEESKEFEMLYTKVVDALNNKKVVVFTHMPKDDWCSNPDYVDGFVYISGHNHRNYYFDDGKKRVYSDNQVGYHCKDFSIKTISVSFEYDWFSEYKDGIYEISKSDYEKFYRGINEELEFNRQFEKLFMIKRNKTYMFLMQSPSGSLSILNGGSIKKAPTKQLDYYYNNLENYSRSINEFLGEYFSFQKRVAKEIKSFGGWGTIHGSIIDIDFESHIYINPLDGSITPYYAESTTSKHVYKNLPSLLKYKCPVCYLKYTKLLESKNDDSQYFLIQSFLTTSPKTTFVAETDMYKISRVLKGLQYATKYNVVRLWDSAFALSSSKENGKMIVSGIIDPNLLPVSAIEHKQKNAVARKEKPVKPFKTKEEKIKIRDDSYKDKISKETGGDVICLNYNGSTEKADYKCNVCGYEWSTRPDHFKDRQFYKCPICKCSKN